ncbi:MAG: ribonuclease H-like domain-containing protein [Caldicoprobacterales bacterium]|nr:hypothetical protein [Clostridiales bacterium]
MIPNLREKLKAISTNCHSKPKTENSDNKSDCSYNRGNLGGHIISSQWGHHVCKKSIYPIDDSYGIVTFKKIRDVNPSIVSQWARLDETLASFSIHDLIFLDTETTGLSLGVGTLAFLIGLGYFEENNFVVEQHVMRDFDEELSMLNEVAKAIGHRKALVSFNGKSYDYPLLENRMVFNRISSYISTAKNNNLHIDLLHPSRRIWSSMLDSCSLTSLEEKILQYYREDDIPGREIPNIYYQYLQDRDETLIGKVLDHNTKDILAMVALFIRLSQIYQSPDQVGLNCYEWLGLAKSWENQGDDERAIYCYSKCIEKGEDQNIILDAKNRLAILYKRSRKWKQAIEIWQSIIDREGNLRIFPLIEMAKYYEHHEKNYDKALMYTDRAIKLLKNIGMNREPGYGIYDIDAIYHRRNRLIRKKKG